MSQPAKTRSERAASGTISRIGFQRGCVRLPSRRLCICVSEPKGRARPFSIRATPATRVVATAPRPGRRTSDRSFRFSFGAPAEQHEDKKEGRRAEGRKHKKPVCLSEEGKRKHDVDEIPSREGVDDPGGGGLGG